MHSFVLLVSAALWIAVFAVRGVALSSPPEMLAPPQQAIPEQVPPPPEVTQQGGGYAGADTCLLCHDDRSVRDSAHGRVVDARTPMAKLGCESCHGPGKAHADAGGDPELMRAFREMSPDETSSTCTTCHNRADHGMWEGSSHQARNLTCTTCHSVHAPKSESAQLVKATPMQLCADCHRDKVAKVDRSGHMPVREGKMTCATCHNPHGSANVRLLRAGFSVAEACTSCHADKRGPFLFEHAPVRENCATCHDPHGSANERMLVHKQPFMCQRCHSHQRHPGTLYDNRVVGTSNRIFARSCVTCHSQVHG
ncbi:MAG TPA: DmsE family decaheme c-type cytochrome, partial [Vicinamibacterales bacterium]|nr:DmsE family decaheme c-type cytochrome [Vicinamibacterales bacterium]